MMPFSLFPFVSRRKQFLILKSLVPVAVFVITIMLVRSRYVSRIKTIQRKQTGAKLSTIEVSKSRSRSIILRENRDEFLDVVLREVSYREINLSARKRNALEYYDEAIVTDEKIVIPGLGEGGAPAHVPKKYEALANSTMGKESFNRILSEFISVNRSIPDSRQPACRNITYNISNLPTMSIITTFKNEAYTSIVRMLHGIFNRTPPSLLKEVILVDDFSSNRDLLGKLERYMATRLPGDKVRIVRLHTHAGLMRARMIGAHLAVGQVLMFLDAHCEVNKAWAEPLLERIKADKTVVACSIIDVVDEETLEYQFSKDHKISVGGFKWNGNFNWIPEPDREKKRKKYSHSSTKSPTMAGGVFAIDRNYFWKYGSYDPGMKIWGGENLEMSFRIWQCGGSIEVIPCSRVGHIFRSKNFPYKFTVQDKVNNLARVARVWLDDYMNLLLKNQYFKAKAIGDVSLRQRFRERKKCKGFQWFLDNVYPEKFKMELDSKYYGRVKNSLSNQCLDYRGSSRNYTLQLYNCSNDEDFDKKSQLHFFSKTGQLRKELACARKGVNNTVEMIWCEQLKPEGSSFVWEYDEKVKHLINLETKLCMSIRNISKGVVKSNHQFQPFLDNCNNTANNQKWEFHANKVKIYL